MASIGRSTDQPALVEGGGRDTRGRILEAAAALVAEVGWGGVTTRAVAARADVTVALLHYHFESKEALLREALLASLEAVLLTVVEPLTTPGPTIEALDAVVERLAGLDVDSPAAAILGEALVRAVRDPVVRDATRDELAAFRGLLADRLASDPSLRPAIDPAATATVLAAALDGLLLHAFVDPSIDVRAAGRALAGLLGPDAPLPDRHPEVTR